MFSRTLGSNRARHVSLSLLIIALTLSLVPIKNSGAQGAASAPATDNWTMFHHDLRLSGVSSSPAPNTNETTWIYETYSSITSSPAIVNGMLYIGCDDGSLYAINADSGILSWSYATGGEIHSSPAVEAGQVYFLSTDGNMYALNASTGALIWSKTLGPGFWDWSSPAVHNGHVFVGVSTGFIYCLDSATGSVVWNASIGEGAAPDSPITVADGKVFSGTHNFDALSPTLVALDESTGSTVWTYNYTKLHPTAIAFVDCNGATVADGDGDGVNEVYFGVVIWVGSGNQAICLDEATGTEKWTSNLNGWSTSTPAVHDGKVFIGSDDYNVYALNASTGSTVWTYKTNGEVWSAPAVADGKIFVGSLDHTVYAINESTGKLVWSYYTYESRIYGSPAVYDGKVYVGNENGKVFAFGPPIMTENLVVRGMNNIVYYRTYNKTTNNWESWNALPGATSDSPAATVIGNELHMVVRSSSGNKLYHGYVNLANNVFSGWTLLSGSTPSAPTLTSNGTVLSLVVRGGDNRIYYRTYSFSPRSWGSWNALTGTTGDSPAAAMLGNDLHIVVRSLTGNALYHIIVQQNVGVVRNWILISGSTPSKPVLTANQTANELYLAVRGGNNRIYWRTYDGAADSWAGWNIVPTGTTCDGPAATALDNKLRIVVRSMAGTTLWQGYVNLATSAFSGWTLLSGSTPSTPTLTS